MSKVAVVYWSGTGNTEAMANAVADGAKASGAEVEIFKPADFDADKMTTFDGVAFGCPSMGNEVLEEDEFEPMFNKLVSSLSGRRIALFGSYGWGDGEWMRTWESDCDSAGATRVCDSVICNEAPDDEGIESCKSLGAALA
ncbi:MAG: flavodoxin [Anaerovoracaceae bacterium]